MKSKLILIFIVIAVVSGVYFIKQQNKPNINNSEVTQKENSLPIKDESIVETQKELPVKESIKSYTNTEISTHNLETDCWASINGTVYDLTDWIKKHPGGKREIISICGKDGSNAFNGQHSGESRPEILLKGFEIGILK